jgi:hypothetical protein
VIKVRFLKADGTLDHEVEAPAGTNLLDLAQREGQPLEGACDSQDSQGQAENQQAGQNQQVQRLAGRDI